MAQSCVEKRAHCAECGEAYNYRGELRQYCQHGHPPRAPQLYQKPPEWWRVRLNEAYPQEIQHYLRAGTYIKRTKLHGQSEVLNFIANIHRIFKPPCLIGIFDHWGFDDSGNLVTEPYANSCTPCHEMASDFATRLGITHAFSHPTWHAPWIERCVRITFFKPEQLR